MLSSFCCFVFSITHTFGVKKVIDKLGRSRALHVFVSVARAEMGNAPSGKTDVGERYDVYKAIRKPLKAFC